MSRCARLIVPDYPLHIVQRGHNRQDVFVDCQDFHVYLGNLSKWKKELGCKVYAFCLMGNHVHLVVDPGRQAANVSRLMKLLAGRQTQYANAGRRRRGTLWEGRFRSSLIASERYLVACCRYVEMNPVRAGIVGDPSDYPWSSFRTRAGLAAVDWLDDPPVSAMLNFIEPGRGGEWEALQNALRRGQPAGDEESLAKLEEVAERRILPCPVGRPV